MHTKVLPKGSARVLAKLKGMESPALSGWTLAGGTGLALHLGHRVSEDFDFFRNEIVDVQVLHEILRQVGTYETLQEAERTLTVIVSDVKVSFFQIPERFLYKTTPYSFFQIADPRDIALMKLLAISSRGSRKDFVDLYTVLRGGIRLKDLFKDLPRKYRAGRTNEYHILKSLTYFEDAEKEPLPRMLVPLDWKECKRYFVREAQAIIVPPA